MKVVILGNGFDLHHEIPTRFDDFRKYLIEQAASDVRDQELERIISRNEYAKGNLEEFIKTVDSLIGVPNKDITWAQFEEKFHQVVRSAYQNLDGRKKFDFYNRTHITFCLALECYLNTLERPKMQYKQMRAALEDADVIVVFNYTDTYKNYIDSTKISNVIHVHGSLEEKEKLVIGYEDEQDIFDLNRSIDRSILVTVRIDTS